MIHKLKIYLSCEVMEQTTKPVCEKKQGIGSPREYLHTRMNVHEDKDGEGWEKKIHLCGVELSGEIQS
jgi:hypothetical protein